MKDKFQKPDSIKRNKWYKSAFHLFFILVFLVFIPFLAFCRKAPEQASKPNLLIIHTDEHNFRTLGCYRDLMTEDQAYMWGEAVVETPYIDQLAEEGLICSHFYATTPVCSPSRSSFLTGKYPQNTPVVTNDIPLSTEMVTFAEILNRHGYATGYAGKWHLDGMPKPGWEPENNFGFEDNRYMFNRGHWKLIEFVNGEPRVGRKNGKPSYGPVGDEKTFTTDWIFDRAIDFIGDHKNVPFCYMVSIPDPHGPDKVREPYNSMFDDQNYKQPINAIKTGKIPKWAPMNSNSYDQNKYYGMVKCIDDNVGKIIQFLKKNDLFNKTIVVFTSDHGDLRGEHGRQNKGVPYEGSSRIPFIIRWPEKITSGAIVNEVLDCTDFLPTILRLMEVPAIGTEEGRDASELFLQGKAPDSWQDVVFLRGTPNMPWIAAVTQRFKLIYAVNDEPWFFDLKKDPNELVNEFHNPEYDNVIKELSFSLLEYGSKYNDPRMKDEKIISEINMVLETYKKN